MKTYILRYEYFKDSEYRFDDNDICLGHFIDGKYSIFNEYRNEAGQQVVRYKGKTLEEMRQSLEIIGAELTPKDPLI